MIENLQQYLEILKNENELMVIEESLDPVLEIPEVLRQAAAAEMPALLFTNPAGYDFPVAGNLFGSLKRIELGLGGKPEKLVEEIAGMAERIGDFSPGFLYGNRKTLLPFMNIGLKKVSASPLKREKKMRMTDLPALKLWPKDGGQFLTLPLVYTEGRDGGSNLGMYRMQIHDGETTGMHWQIHKGGGFHYYEYEKAGLDMPVSVFLGGSPALILSAVAPLPEKIPELMLASFLQGGKVKYRKEGKGWLYPAEAEFAFLGTVSPGERKGEGPFGDHNGYYSLVHPFPVFRIKKILARRNAVFPVSVVGKPRQEDFYIGEYFQKLFSPVYSLLMPGVRSIHTYGDTGFHALAAADVRGSYEGEDLAHAMRILGEGVLSLTKVLLLIDGSRAPMERFRDFLAEFLARFSAASGFFVYGRTAADTLDYTGGSFNKGSKAVLSARMQARELPVSYNGELCTGMEDPRVFCPGCLVCRGNEYEKDSRLKERVWEFFRNTDDWPMIIITDDSFVAEGPEKNFLWTVFTRFDPDRDMFAGTGTENNHFVPEGPLVIDARMKGIYPAEVSVMPEITEKASAVLRRCDN